jgi:hypothetical protein
VNVNVKGKGKKRKKKGHDHPKDVLVWTREGAGVYIGELNGRRVARVRRCEDMMWRWNYRGPSMVIARTGFPKKRLAEAKADVGLLVPVVEAPVAVEDLETLDVPVVEDHVPVVEDHVPVVEAPVAVEDLETVDVPVVEDPVVASGLAPYARALALAVAEHDP